MNLNLTRSLDNGQCTLGRLDLLGIELQSLERPWISGSTGGMPGRSCVPCGTYQLVLHDTEAHPKTFALVNEALGVYHYSVPQGRQGRTAVLIHVANRSQELRGCIALGMSRVLVAGEWRIAESRKAIDMFYSRVSWKDGHTLTIKEAV